MGNSEHVKAQLRWAKCREIFNRARSARKLDEGKQDQFVKERQEAWGTNGRKEGTKERLNIVDMQCSKYTGRKISPQ